MALRCVFILSICRDKLLNDFIYVVYKDCLIQLAAVIVVKLEA